MAASQPSIETQEFLATIMPSITSMDAAFHNGNPGPRGHVWSHAAPVTLFGALLHKSGWKEIEAAFAFLASGFSDCKSFRYDILSAGASGDLAYLVGIEHTTASVRGAPPKAYELRVTTLFRREAGQWRIFHRHADPLPNTTAAGEQLARFGPEKTAASPEKVPIMVVHKTPSLTKEHYEAVVRGLTGGKPRLESPDDVPTGGLLVHVAGQTDEGFVIFDVFDSQDAFDRFGSLVGPIAMKAGIKEPPKSYPLHTYIST